MPYYRLGALGMVHMRGRKLAPPCQFHVLIDGKRVPCLFPTSLLCDWPTGLGKTCSAPMCAQHALQFHGRDFCPTHNAQRGLLSRLLEGPKLPPCPACGEPLTLQSTRRPGVVRARCEACRDFVAAANSVETLRNAILDMQDQSWRHRAEPWA